MPHQRLHVRKRPQRHHLGDDNRLRQTPGPVVAGAFAHRAYDARRPEKKRAPAGRSPAAEAQVDPRMGTQRRRPGRVWQVFGSRQGKAWLMRWATGFPKFFDAATESGSLAIFAAIRRASSLVSRLAAERRPGSSPKYT